MAANDTLGLNQVFQIYHEDESAYEGLVMHKSATDSVVMSLGDSITGDVYWRDNELELSMKEYVMYNGVKYVLVNPPTIVREGMVSDNSELKGMTKYSFKFYHPMYQLGNFPFSDVAVTNDQKKYLSENKVFSWIGTANDYLAKLNKNLDGTQWKVEMSSNFPNDKKTEMSDVLAFDKNTVADALKTAYDTWGVPYVIDVVTSSEASYNSGKRFKVVWGLPSNEIYENATKKQQGIPYIFKMGKGVGLKNNSRTPRNNKIITRIAGYGSETNIPYGYPQIVWTGNQSWDYTINNISSAANSYPIYDGIVGGQKVHLIKHPFTRTHLMPNVYVDAVNKKVNPNATGYDPDIELKDYYDATVGEDYPNPINLNAPSYDIHEFDDIKPELGSESIVSVTPLNPDLTPASSWDDTMDDDGKFIQSYFQITLPTLSFDIYACAAITETMEINMRSGACLGCTFPVEVDWEDYKANFYNEDGEFDPVIHSVEGDGHVRNGKKYPNSSNSSTPVTLILKKENTTFGVLMPNTYQHPATGDTFVVLGISLPTSYITSAQTRLDNAMKSYMLENNVHYYDYPLKFDEAFLRNNTYILEQLKPNAIVRFEFAGATMPLYVKQMNVKYGEGVLPKYDITLTDNVEVVLNQIGQVADDVEKLSSLLSLLRQSYDSNVWVALAKKLSKTDDDTAQGFIRFVKGLQVGERFDSGLLGEGGVFRKDADGTTYIEADKLYIRMKAYFDTVEIRKYMHSGGNRIASPAGAKCVRVENMAWYAAEGKFVPVDEYGTYRKKDITDEEYVVATGLDIVRYRCYFRGEDNDGDKVTNDFLIGDQAYCKITNGDTASLMMHSYWRLVVGKNQNGSLTEDGEFWIDLANYHDAYGQPVNVQWVNSRGVTVVHKSHQAGSDIPRAQDDIVQLGSADDTTRQGAIIEHSSGEDAPSYKIYQGIDDFSFKDTNYISLGYDSETGRAYMNVYGDAYIGDPDESTFIKYEQENSVTHRPKMTIRAEVEFQDPDDPTSITTLEQFANTVITDIENIQSQIDGELDTWYYAGIPTLNNLPASQWTTDDLKKMHVGDLYYDKDSGFVYRFIYDTSVTPNVYKWVQIHDDAISEALRQAEKAQDTADHKRRVFVTQPPVTSHPDGNYVEYDVGDLWANASGTFTYTEEGQTKTVTYNNDLLRCRVSKPIRNASGVVIDGTFSITDWELATRYTDDTKIDSFLDGYQGNLTAIRNQIDQKAETYYEDNDPSTNQWGSEHVGDMWFCTSDHADPSMFKKGTTWVWQEYTNQTTGVVTYAWAEAQIPQVVFDTLDRKKAIYVAWNAWITTDSFGVQHNNLQLRDLFIPSEDTTGGGVQYKANRVYRCVSLNPTTFQEIDYVDNQDWSNWIQNTYNQNISNIENQIDKKAETWYQNTDPSTTASPNGWYGEDNAEHVGDLWLVSIDVTGSNIYKAGTTWYFKDNGDGVSPRYTWEKQVVPQEVFDYADGKAAIFVGNPPTTYNINDMWFIGDGVSSSQLPTGCVAGDVVVSSAKRNGVYNKSDWTKKDRYTDDTKFNTYISQIINGTSDQSDSAVVAQALHAIKAALNENTTISGGLILTSLISLKSNSQVWAGISGLYDANETGGGIAAWYGGGRVDHEAYPSSSDYAKSLFRFDGSGYVASGNITWNANGAVTIKNITTLSDSQNTNLLNELATFNSAFTFATSGSGSTTVLSITPNVPFTALTILDTSVSPNVGRPVATQKWVNDNFMTIAAFERLFNAIDANGNKVSHPYSNAFASIKAMVGFWTNQYISAFGQNSSSGGGGVGDVTWDLLASSSDNHQIALSHLTTALSGYITLTSADNRYLSLSGGTMNNTNVVKNLNADLLDGFNSSEIMLLYGGTNLSPSSTKIVDLDTITEIGNYYCSSVSNGKNYVTHGPDGVYAFRLVVGRYWSGNEYMYQRIYPYNLPKVYERINAAATVTWSDWYLVQGDLNNLSKYVTLDTEQNISGNKTFTGGTITIYGEGTTENDTQASIIFSIKNTTTGQTHSSCYIRAFHVNSSGSNLIIRPGGNLIMGGGESASTFHSQMTTKIGENTYLLADNTVYLEAGANRVANRKGFYISTSGDLIPCAAESSSDNTHNIGSTTARLANIYAVNFHGSLDGNATTATKLASMINVTIKDADSTNAGSAVSVDGSAAVTLLLPSTIKASLTGNASTATTLKTSRTLWGQSFNGSANVKGDLYMLIDGGGLNDDSARLKFNSGDVDSSTTVRRSPYIQAIHTGDYGKKRLSVFQSDASDYTTDFVEVMSILSNGRVGIGTTSPSVLFDVNGYAKTKRLYLSSSVYLEYDSSNSGVHLVGAGLYVDTYVSAYGANSQSGGGSVSLNQPLSGINSAGLGAPSAAGSAIVWNGSSWTYSNNSNLRVASLSSLGSITVHSNVTSQYGGFAVSGKNDNYILTAGGGTKLFKLAIDSTSLEDGQALVYDESTSSWVNGEGGTAYTLPLAANGTRGGVQIGYSESNSGSDSIRNYAVKLSSEKMYVNVPWKDENVKVVKVDNSSSEISYYPTFYSSVPTTNEIGSVYVNNGLKYTYNYGTSSAEGVAMLTLGVSGSTTASKKIGKICLVTAYGSGTIVSAASTTVTYTLPNKTGTIALVGDAVTLATSSVIGGIKIGYTTSGKNYAVQLDGNNKAYVNVPWENSTYTLPVATTSALGGIKVGYSPNGSNYKVQLDNDNNAYVQVPWTDTKNTAGSTAYTGTGDRLYIIGADSMTTYRQTYADVNCYIKDNCLYSNGSKVLTSITSSLVTGALGYTPANSSDLSTYLPKSGGTMTGSVFFGDANNTSYMDIRFYRNNHMMYIAPGEGSLVIAYRSNVSDSNTDYAIKLANNSFTYNGNVVIHAGNISSYLSGYDTKNTAGITQSTSKLYLVGSPSTTTNAGAYSVTNTNANLYIDADGILHAPKFETGKVTNNGIGYSCRLGTSASGSGGLAMCMDNTTNAHMFVWITTSKLTTLGNVNFNANTRVYGKDIIFYSVTSTVGTERMVIKEGGNVGIGTSDPSYKLHVNGTGYFNSTLRINAGIEAPNGDGLLVYAPSSGWEGINSSQWGVGCASKQGVIRSNNSNLLHYKGGTSYPILDGSNYASIIGSGLLPTSGGDMTGHIYLTGAKANSSTGNTSQIIFGTSSSNHVAISSNTDAVIINPTSSTTTGQIVLGTNGVASYFTSSGNFGIGTDSPQYKLHVNGTSYLGGNTTAAGYIYPAQNTAYSLGSSSTRWSTVYCASVNASSDCSISGNVTISGVLGVGGSNGSFKLYVSGSAKVSTYLGVATDPDTSDSTNKLFVGGAVKASAYNYMSDVRKKNIIDYIDKDIAEIANAPIFDYTWKDSEDRSLHVGSSAQYWLNVLPHVVSQSSDGFYFMDYSCTALASVVITARRVLDHEGRIRLLEVENQALRKEIEQLKKAA